MLKTPLKANACSKLRALTALAKAALSWINAAAFDMAWMGQSMVPPRKERSWPFRLARLRQSHNCPEECDCCVRSRAARRSRMKANQFQTATLNANIRA
jgi:hypothetical protein